MSGPTGFPKGIDAEPLHDRVMMVAVHSSDGELAWIADERNIRRITAGFFKEVSPLWPASPS